LSSFVVTINAKEYMVSLGADGHVALNGVPASVDVQRLDERTFSVLVDVTSATIVAEEFDGVYRVLRNGLQLEATVESERERLLKKYDKRGGAARSRLEIHAPMPALVVRVEVMVGEEVKQGQGLIILEAMKMENEIKAHQAGIVKEIYAGKGKPVEKGELLMLME